MQSGSYSTIFSFMDKVVDTVYGVYGVYRFIVDLRSCGFAKLFMWFMGLWGLCI